MAEAPPVLHPLGYATNRFTMAGDLDESRFFTAGRAIFAFDETNGGEKIAVLDTFYGLEFVLERAESGKRVENLVVDCLQVDENGATRTASLLVLTCSLHFPPLLCLQEVDVDFELRTFAAGKPIVVAGRQSSLASKRGRKLLHATDEPQAVLISVFHHDRVAFYRFERGRPAVEPLPHVAVNTLELDAVHVHRGRVFSVEKAGLRLSCFWRSELGEEATTRSATEELRSFVCSFVHADCLFVIRKKLEGFGRLEVVRVPVKEQWLEGPSPDFLAPTPIDCPQFASVSWAACPWAFVDGILSLHPIQSVLSIGETMSEFHSFRVPVGRPESLGYAAWFQVLQLEGVTIDVPQRGACRRLSNMGLFANKLVPLGPHRFLLGRSAVARPFERLEQLPPSQDEIFQRLEEEELQLAIEQSLQTGGERPGPSGFQQPQVAAGRSVEPDAFPFVVSSRSSRDWNMDAVTSKCKTGRDQEEEELQRAILQSLQLEEEEVGPSDFLEYEFDEEEDE